MSGLQRIRLFTHHRFERSNRLRKIILPEINKANIQPNAGYCRRQPFCLLQHLERCVPLLPAHVDHAQICVSPGHFRIARKRLPKRPLCPSEIPAPQRGLALRENLLRISGLTCLRPSLGLRGRRCSHLRRTLSRRPKRKKKGSPQPHPHCYA